MLLDFEGLALNTHTVRTQWTLQQSIEGAIRTGYSGISVSRQEIETAGLAVAAEALRCSGLVVTGLNPSRLITLADQQDIRAAIDDLSMAIEQAATIGARCLVVVSGGMGSSKDITQSRARFREVLHAIAPIAAAAGVRLGIEPLHPTFAADRSTVCDLRTARELAFEHGSDVGIVLDVYHTWWDPRLNEEMVSVGADRLFAYHVSDWLVSSIDRLNDRGMIGDGIIDIGGISRVLSVAGYKGYVEIEVISSYWRQQNPDVVLTLAKTKVLELLKRVEHRSE